MNFLLLGLVLVFLLAGLVSIGIGNKRWNWGTVTGAILTLLTACAYLVIASRMAAYEQSWHKTIEDKQKRLAEVRDAMVPQGPNGTMVKQQGSKSIAELTDERIRWQRAFDRIDSWRGRRWEHCSFEPPTLGAKAADGTVTLNLGTARAAAAADAGAAAAPPEEPPAAEGAAKPAAGKPPLDEGAVVYLFDERPIDEDGRYLGAVKVKGVALDAATNSCTLTVAALETPDAYDKTVWGETYEKTVTVYDRLPNDRWLAFSSTSRDDDGSGTMPPVTRPSIDKLEAMIKAFEADETFASEMLRHDDESVEDKDDAWKRLRERLEAGDVVPGAYWATVRLTKAVDQFGAGLDDEDAKRELPEGAEVEFDLQTAFKLQDDELGTIQQVRYRRPLRDGGALLHGGLVEGADGAGIPVAGMAGIVDSVNREIRTLEDWIARLAAARKSIEAEAAATDERKRAYAADLETWIRDADEATRLTAAFTAQLDDSRNRRDAVKADVIKLARDLRAVMGALVARIDAVAPPPDRGAVATP